MSMLLYFNVYRYISKDSGSLEYVVDQTLGPIEEIRFGLFGLFFFACMNLSDVV